MKRNILLIVLVALLLYPAITFSFEASPWSGTEAVSVTADTTNFGTNLSANDSTVQAALETLDDLSVTAEFTGLTDTPADYTGHAAKTVVVNGTETGLEFAVPAGGGDVVKVGTPVDTQIGVWTGDGTIKGSSVTISATGAVEGNDSATFTNAVQGGSITDGTATLTSGALSGVTTIGASGAITGGSITDGTATLTGGALTGVTTATIGATVIDSSGVTLAVGDDLIGGNDSDILLNTNKFTVAGATGNTLVEGTLDIGALGVKITHDGDGQITLLGKGGTNEDLSINLDTSNNVVFDSTTGVDTVTFNGMTIQTGGGGIATATGTISDGVTIMDGTGGTSGTTVTMSSYIYGEAEPIQLTGNDSLGATDCDSQAYYLVGNDSVNRNITWDKGGVCFFYVYDGLTTGTITINATGGTYFRATHIASSLIADNDSLTISDGQSMGLHMGNDSGTQVIYVIGTDAAL